MSLLKKRSKLMSNVMSKTIELKKKVMLCQNSSKKKRNESRMPNVMSQKKKVSLFPPKNPPKFQKKSMIGKNVCLNF